jgi:hypothetical protein
MPGLLAVIERRRLDVFVVTLAAIAFVGALDFTPIHVADFWIQLQVGDLIRETGSIPPTFGMTYTEAADVPYVEARWLACLFFSHLYEIAGYDGMIVVKGLLGLASFALIVCLVRQVDPDALLALALASLASLAINFRILMRPELVSFVFALVSLNLLQAFVRTGKPLWLLGLIPTSILWVNFHPSFLVGLAFSATFAAGELVDAAWTWLRRRIRPDFAALSRRVGWLAGACLAMSAATLINPYGIGLHEHMSRVEGSDFIRANVWEWQPIYHPRFFREPFFFLFLALFALVVISGIVGRRKLRATPLILVLGFFPLAVSGIRHAAWFEIVAAFFLAHTLGHTVLMRRHRSVIAAVLTLVLLAGTWITFERGNTRGRRPGFANDAPLNPEVIAFIESSDIAGNVFHSYSYGDQLAYHFHPRILVAMDTRIYPERFYREYRSITPDNPRLLAPPDVFRAYFERYDVRTIVATRSDARIWGRLGYDRPLLALGFEQVYIDPKTVVFRR